MTRDTLFLLRPDFLDGGEKFYCPECAEVNGVLSFYPQLRERVDVRLVDFPRPRGEVIALIGEPNQSCPVLVLAGAPVAGLKDVEVGNFHGRSFIAGARDIGRYFAHVWHIGKPH